LIENILKKAQKEQRRFLLSYEASDVLRALDIRMPQSYVARNIDESVMYADKIGYPVVLKVVSRNILHKSDVGGVALNLENKNEVMNAFQAIIYNCRKHKPNALIEGVEVTEMVRRGGDVETIIGARRDESFGPLVMFGLGGIYVEIMKDVSFRSFPVSKKEAMDMIREIKSYPLLLGVRGETKKDINAVVDTILKVGTALQRFREISDIELNPLLVHDEGEGTRALDVRILLAKPEEVEINEKDGRYVSKQERRENLFNCRPGQSLGQRIWLP
jgi:acyl-CoA synthetase (NDP forming)